MFFIFITTKKPVLLNISKANNEKQQHNQNLGEVKKILKSLKNSVKIF